MKRENFKSRLGFILVSAGCAIGIGNVWKFPYITGANGGAIFVLFYLIFLVILGLPVMTMELAIGRNTRLSIIGAYKKLEKPGSKWHIHGYASVLGCLLLMMYYTTVSGWMLAYAWKFATGTFDGLSGEAVAGVFDSMLADPWQMILFLFITVAFGFGVLSFGVQKGLENITKVMMIGLLVLIIVLAVNSLLLPGAGEGVAFYLLPSIERASDVGIGNVMVAAMSQAFFTLGLGIASIEIFGSYMDKSHTLVGESIRIITLDTFVAIMSGLIIFPACFSFGISPAQGPPLIFITLPQVFLSMTGGRIWGTLFFVFMTFASFSTAIAVFENLVASCEDTFKLKRKLSVLICFVAVFLLSIPCVLGYNVWQDVHLIRGGNVLDTEDFLVSNILIGAGSIVFTLFCSHKFGWGFDNYLEEVNTGKGIKMPRWIKYYLMYGLPVLILAIMIIGLI